MNDKEITDLIDSKIASHEFKVFIISGISGFIILSIIFLWLLKLENLVC